MKQPAAVRERSGADVALLCITAIWGATFVTVKGALADADTFSFLALRFGLGAVVAASLSLRHLRNLVVWRRGAILGALMFGGYALQTLGLETTSPARSAFITGLTVLFVPFAAQLVARIRPAQRAEPLTFTVMLSVCLAAFGTWQLTGANLSDRPATGDLLTLGCAVIYAGHIAATSRLGENVPPFALVAVQLFVTAGLSALAGCVVDRRLHSTPSFWAAVALTGVVASALAIAVQVWAQARTSAVRAGVIYALEPVFAVGVSLLLGQSAPSTRELVGGATVIGAVVFAETVGARRKFRA